MSESKSNFLSDSSIEVARQLTGIWKGPCEPDEENDCPRNHQNWNLFFSSDNKNSNILRLNGRGSVDIVNGSDSAHLWTFTITGTFNISSKDLLFTKHFSQLGESHTVHYIGIGELIQENNEKYCLASGIWTNSLSGFSSTYALKHLLPNTMPEPTPQRPETHRQLSVNSESERPVNLPTCVICVSEDVSAVFMPCMHCVCCSTCAQQMMTQAQARCPMCRVGIQGTTRIFFP